MMGKKPTASKPKAIPAGKKRSLRPQSPAARRTKKATPKAKPRRTPAISKRKAAMARVKSAPPKLAARAKRATPRKPAPKAEAPETEKRSRAVEKLLALKAEKAEKPAPKKEGFLIKASKKAKQENLTGSARFVRRMPTPVPVEASPKPARKPAKVLLRKKDLDQLRQALEEERQRLIAQMAALDETASLTGPSEVNENVPGYSIHLAEYASENQVVETTLAQRALQAERLAEIEEALLRINNPGYGICQNCGKEIGLERLKVKPSAQFCVPCRQLKEQGRI